MNKTELINKLLWLGYTSAEEGTEKRKEAISAAHNLVDEYLEAINYTHCCETFKDKQKLSFKDWKFSKGLRYVCGHNFKDNDGDIYDSDEIEKMYEHYLNL